MRDTKPDKLDQETWLFARHMASEGDRDAQRLAEQVVVQAQLYSEAMETLRKHQRAIAIVGEALYEEAINRDWCDEYNTFASQVNERAEMEVLQSLKRTYWVTFKVEVSSEAKTEKEATQQAERQVAELLDGLEFSVTFDKVDQE